jgi:hypothetical protein
MRLQEITKELLNTFAQHPNLPQGLLSDAENELRAAQLALTACQVIGDFGEYRETLTLYGMEKELKPLIAQLTRKVDRETKVLIKMVYKLRKAESLGSHKDEPITQADLNWARYHCKRKKLYDQKVRLQEQAYAEKDPEKCKALKKEWSATLDQLNELYTGGGMY